MRERETVFVYVCLCEGWVIEKEKQTEKSSGWPIWRKKVLLHLSPENTHQL